MTKSRNTARKNEQKRSRAIKKLKPLVGKLAPAKYSTSVLDAIASDETIPLTTLEQYAYLPSGTLAKKVSEILAIFAPEQYARLGGSGSKTAVKKVQERRESKNIISEGERDEEVVSKKKSEPVSKDDSAKDTFEPPERVSTAKTQASTEKEKSTADSCAGERDGKWGKLWLEVEPTATKYLLTRAAFETKMNSMMTECIKRHEEYNSKNSDKAKDDLLSFLQSGFSGLLYLGSKNLTAMTNQMLDVFDMEHLKETKQTSPDPTKSSIEPPNKLCQPVTAQEEGTVSGVVKTEILQGVLSWDAKMAKELFDVTQQVKNNSISEKTARWLNKAGYSFLFQNAPDLAVSHVLKFWGEIANICNAEEKKHQWKDLDGVGSRVMQQLTALYAENPWAGIFWEQEFLPQLYQAILTSRKEAYKNYEIQSVEAEITKTIDMSSSIVDILERKECSSVREMWDKKLGDLKQRKDKMDKELVLLTNKANAALQKYCTEVSAKKVFGPISQVLKLTKELRIAVSDADRETLKTFDPAVLERMEQEDRAYHKYNEELPNMTPAAIAGRTAGLRNLISQRQKCVSDFKVELKDKQYVRVLLFIRAMSTPVSNQILFSLFNIDNGNLFNDFIFTFCTSVTDRNHFEVPRGCQSEKSELPSHRRFQGRYVEPSESKLSIQLFIIERNPKWISICY